MTTRLPFRQHSVRDKTIIVLVTLLTCVAVLACTAFLVLLSLFGRSIHGPPPSLLVYAIPLVAAIIVGRFAFVVMLRILGRR